MEKLLAYLYDASKKLKEMRSDTMPTLKIKLEGVLEQRMLLEFSDKNSDKLSGMDVLLRNLKNALYDAEDILDLVDYYRIEKELGLDSKTTWVQWCWQRLCDSAREKSAPVLRLVKQMLCWLWVKQRSCRLWQWVRVAGERSAPLLQRVKQRLYWLWKWVRIAGEKSGWLLQMARQGLSWLWRWVIGSEELLPVDSTSSASLVQRISLWCRYFDFRSFFSCICICLSKVIEGARYYRDWSLDEFGLASYKQSVVMESNCTIMGPLYVVLKENMERVEHLIEDAQEIISSKKKDLGLHLHCNANRSHVVAANSRAAVTTAAPPSLVIGRDNDCDKIVAMLHREEHNNTQCYSVIGIHGIGGSGKSTLAQLVCAREKKDRQEKKHGHFNLIMWIHVSQDFSVDTIFKEMFEAATRTSCPKFNNLDTLQNNLKKELHGKRFLLVLDDVWYNNRVGDVTLQRILLPLNAGEAGSKILVTS